MELIKVSSSGLSQTYRYSDGEERIAIQHLVEYMGFKLIMKLIHGIKLGQIKNTGSVHFLCSMAGVQGYPVDCFITWISEYYGTTLIAEEED